MGLSEHSGHTLCKSAIGPFCNTVLMRLIAYRVLASNTRSVKILCHLRAHVLASLVISKTSKLVTRLQLSSSLEAFECVKHTALMRKRDNGPVSARIANERYPIAPSLSSSNRQWAMNIGMDKLEWSAGSMRRSLWNRTSVQLTSEAWFANRIRSRVLVLHVES